MKKDVLRLEHFLNVFPICNLSLQLLCSYLYRVTMARRWRRANSWSLGWTWLCSQPKRLKIPRRPYPWFHVTATFYSTTMSFHCQVSSDGSPVSCKFPATLQDAIRIQKEHLQGRQKSLQPLEKAERQHVATGASIPCRGTPWVSKVSVFLDPLHP